MVQLPRREFQRLVLKALESLPPAIKVRMDNLDVVVRDWPTADDLEQVHLKDRHELLGLYLGIPLTERSDYHMVLPDVISIFRNPIQERCATREAVVEEVRVTVVHEVAHHFGIADEALDETVYR